MKKIFKGSLILLLGLMLASPVSWAYTELPNYESDETDGGGDGAGDAEDNDVKKAEQSLRDAAIAARNRAIAISIAAGGVAAFFGYKCVAGNLGACAVAAVALSGAISTAQYANDKSLAANINVPKGDDPEEGDTDGTWCNSVETCKDDGGGGGGGDTTIADNDNNRRIRDTKDLLDDVGYSVDDKGNIKTPKGTFSPSQLTPCTLASLGVTPELQAEFRAKMQEEIARTGAGASEAPTAGGGGGGPATVLRAQRGAGGWMKDSTPSRGLASVDGLSVRRGDDVIGIQSADIFDMVHKKYQQLRQQNNFLE